MTWRKLFLLWPTAVALGAFGGGVLGAIGSAASQANLPVGDIYVPLLLATSLITAAMGAWNGLVAGLTALGAVALFDRRLHLPARRRGLIVGAAAGGGGLMALLLFRSGPSSLESPWTFPLSGAVSTVVAFLAVRLCKARSTRRKSGVTSF
ncbi:hypothetical protein [Herbiconiux flava]|uniref:Uncharacterized protein n=1 Tax=Herbiconiux flava TaxID=881268 RepID=A0A852SQI8_9MICO|nr:hypothetical protein [Herbiconiux flava]NYD70990.1 hypothetical protein [Herbiconiux flava]GLK19046.1 hypothetical protein GCM10017602_35280 [Herbiconiux flava]